MYWYIATLRVHPTWLFTVYCGGIVLGLWLSQFVWAAEFSHWMWYLVSIAFFALAWWVRYWWLLIFVCVAGMLLGLSRGGMDQTMHTVYDALIGKEVTISGVIKEDIDVGKQGDALIRLGDVSIGQQDLPGMLWVSTSEAGELRRSDRVTIRGQLSDGFGSFGASMYRAEIVEAERPVPGDIALDVRDSFGEKVRIGIEDPAASLGMGYLTGQRRALPEDLNIALVTAGLTHVVVASGYNLTILVRAARRLLAPRSRFLAVFVAGLLVISFMAVTGLSPSMSRAGLVAGVALGAWYFGRKFHPVTILLFAAAVTGLLQPNYVWGNLGWQLSFAAFGGVMLVAPLAQAYFFGVSKPGVLRQIVGETVSAQLATFPLLVMAFGYFSNVAIIANALILPFIPLAMLLTFIAGLAGYVHQGLAEIVAIPAQLLLDAMVWVATSTASVDWALRELTVGPWFVVGFYLALVLACLWMKRATGLRLRDQSIVD